MKKIIKYWIQKILLYLLKKLNMPRPFNEFTSQNMLEIYTFIGQTTDYANVMTLHNIPDLYENNTSIIANKTNVVGILEYTRKKDNAKASINIDKDYNVDVKGLDSQTEALIKNLVKSYLQQANFIS